MCKWLKKKKIKHLSILKLYWLDVFSHRYVTSNSDLESYLIKILSSVDLTDGIHRTKSMSLSLRIPVEHPNKMVWCLSTRLPPHTPNKWCLSIRLSPHTQAKYCQPDCLSTQLNAVCHTNCSPHPNQMLSTRLSPTPQSNGACQADYLPTPNQMLSTKLFPYTPAKRCQLDCLPHPNQLVSVHHTVFPYPSQMLSTRISPYNPIKCCLSIRLLPHPGHFKHYMQSSPSWTESCNDSWYSFHNNCIHAFPTNYSHIPIFHLTKNGHYLFFSWIIL